MVRYLRGLLFVLAIGMMAGCMTTETHQMSVSDYPGTFVPSYYDSGVFPWYRNYYGYHDYHAYHDFYGFHGAHMHR